MTLSFIIWLYGKVSFRYGKYLAKLACPDNEPLHFHHDGCPVCDDLPW